MREIRDIYLTPEILMACQIRFLIRWTTLISTFSCQALLKWSHRNTTMRVAFVEVGLFRGDTLYTYSVCVKETPRITQCELHRQLLFICYIILKGMESSCPLYLHAETKGKLV